jgi:hypothetical protein
MQDHGDKLRRDGDPPDLEISGELLQIQTSTTPQALLNFVERLLKGGNAGLRVKKWMRLTDAASSCPAPGSDPVRTTPVPSPRVRAEMVRARGSGA